ncbi:ornithine--oxo-acid transaminase [Paenibacillus sp. IB182496]|uniref:ornithine aminotransferase n=1 Tax=Paenibacillus sabuli TaxID=2772509 RepID=A0A927BQN5_9BACL|nr:ornithine--oxo-acid transaminase [Paenibacillus sabuli]MBD2844961.1 ornithine--oxo-acid transaminase [Paenibacillus sabuli]
MRQAELHGARNYRPLPVVIARAEGVWMYDLAGRRYLDMLSAYSALNQGHRHPRILAALREQAERLTLASRAFHTDVYGAWCARVAALAGLPVVLPMNTGAEAVETALKAARRWAYDVKGVPPGQAEIIVCSGNFHGRTLGAISLSDEPDYRRGFEPLLTGVRIVPYGDAEALQRAITPATAAFLCEPIQGEAGVVVPPDGYLRQVRELCDRSRVLWIADEIQTGLGRTGRRFACDWEEVRPDLYVLGKALGGGVLPISCVVGGHEVMDVFEPGSHGSTFGGNPLACAVSLAALEVLEDEGLAARAAELGERALERLRRLRAPLVKQVRGRGLLLGVELHAAARPYCERLLELGVLCKETRETVIRLAPPLVIAPAELDWALDKVERVLAQ